MLDQFVAQNRNAVEQDGEYFFIRSVPLQSVLLFHFVRLFKTYIKIFLNHTVKRHSSDIKSGGKSHDPSGYYKNTGASLAKINDHISFQIAFFDDRSGNCLGLKFKRLNRHKRILKYAEVIFYHIFSAGGDQNLQTLRVFADEIIIKNRVRRGYRHMLFKCKFNSFPDV